MFKTPLQLPCLYISNQKEIEELADLKISCAAERKIVWVDFYRIDVVEDNEGWQPEDKTSPKSNIYAGTYYWECLLSKVDVRELITKHIAQENATKHK